MVVAGGAASTGRRRARQASHDRATGREAHQQPAHPRDELGGVDRLDLVVIGTGTQAARPWPAASSGPSRTTGTCGRSGRPRTWLSSDQASMPPTLQSNTARCGGWSSHTAMAWSPLETIRTWRSSPSSAVLRRRCRPRSSVTTRISAAIDAMLCLPAPQRCRRWSRRAVPEGLWVGLVGCGVTAPHPVRRCGDRRFSPRRVPAAARWERRGYPGLPAHRAPAARQSRSRAAPAGWTEGHRWCPSTARRETGPPAVAHRRRRRGVVSSNVRSTRSPTCDASRVSSMGSTYLVDGLAPMALSVSRYCSSHRALVDGPGGASRCAPAPG